MKQILHILKKDLRRYAWAWISLICLSVIEVYLQGTSSGLMESNFNKALSMLSSMIGSILVFIVMVLIVQEETLVDPDADWVSRPVHRGKLLAGKLLCVLLFAGISQLAQVFILLLNGGSARIPFALLEIFPMLAIWLGQVFLAAQTRSLPRYLLLVVCLYAGVMLLFLLSFLGNVFTIGFNGGLLPVTTPDHIASLIQTVYWLVAGIGLLAFMYHTRRIRTSWLLLVPISIIALLLSPGDRVSKKFSRGSDVRLELKHLTQGGTMYADGENLAEIRAVFSLSDIPEDTDLWTSISNASIQSGTKKIDIEPWDTTQRYRPEGDGLRSVTIGYAPEEKLADLGDEFTVDFFQNISLSKQVEVGRLPLREGSTYVKNGTRLMIRNFYHNNNELSVSLGATIPNYQLEPRSGPRNASMSMDAFDGEFSFALGDGNGRVLRDFGLSRSFSFMESTSSGTISTQMPEDQQPESHDILVYARQILESTYEFTNQKTSFAR